MQITVFSDSDLKTNGKFKARNNSISMNEEQFKEYVKTNNLSASYGYIDLIGSLSNGKKFRCWHLGMLVGVSGIVKEINNANKVCMYCYEDFTEGGKVEQDGATQVAVCPKCLEKRG